MHHKCWVGRGRPRGKAPQGQRVVGMAMYPLPVRENWH